MAEVMIGTADGQMPAYVATPGGTGPWPGVVVIHDFAGMSHDLRNQADWLASEGYLAAAPDLYYWGSRLRCLWTIMCEVTAGQGRTVAGIDAARDWLAARPMPGGRWPARARWWAATARRTGRRWAPVPPPGWNAP